MSLGIVAPEKLPRQVREIENLWITLPDGCRLGARVWLPVDAEDQPVPAILEYLPYRKRDGTVARDAHNHPYMAAHGYACVRVDMRGNGDSDGLMLDEYLAQEQDDAVAVIGWLAAQPWCNGNLGMMGISWGGFNALQVAARRPPALKAIVTVCSTDDRYADDIHYKGGALLMENLGWSSTMLAYSSRPPDPELVGARWRTLWRQRLEHMPLLAANWLRHPARDDYWRHGSVCEDFAAIEAATLIVGGWLDPYSNAIPRLLAGLRCPARAIIGPWLHKYPHLALPQPTIGFLQECLRWWDTWLKGVDRGVMSDPRLRVYLQRETRPAARLQHQPGRWLALEQWPPAGGLQNLYLDPGRLAPAPGEDRTCLLCSPQDTGTASGEFGSFWLGPELPTDQREDDARSLAFDTEVLARDLDIAGAPLLELALASDRPQATLVARLCDVWPDGTSARVTYGVLNLCHRDGHAEPQPLAPGHRYRILMALDDIAYTFAAGHRLRLSLSSAYWPLLWPAPQTATLTVSTGPGCALALPLLGDHAGAEPAFAAAEGTPAMVAQSLRTPHQTRHLELDRGEGLTRLRIVDDFGATRLLPHGLLSAEIAREHYTIRHDDPLSARAEIHWTEELSRGSWSVRTETRCTQHADAKQFYLSASLQAFEGEELFFERSWEDSIPRRNN